MSQPDRVTPSQTDSDPSLAGAAAAAIERGRETKERILDAAEQLFAERGFEGTSMRAVTQAAGVSVSAVNYHFGSKHALLRESLRRRVEPATIQRLELLQRAEAAAGDAAPSVEAILDAFLRPVFAERAARPDSAREARFVAARLYAERPELVKELKRELFGPVAERFLPALVRALPDRRPEDVHVAFQFAVGAMVHVISGNLADAPLAETATPISDEALLPQMVAFLAAGLRARPEVTS